MDPCNVSIYSEIFEKAADLMGTASAFFADYKAQQLKKWFPEYNQPGMTILDFGCGDGAMTRFTSYYFNHAHICGIDSSHESIEFAQQYYETIQFDMLDNLQTNYPSNSFDLIYAAEVFHHIPHNQHEKWIRELVRITKSNGQIIIMELNPLNPFTNLRFKFNPVEKTSNMIFPLRTKNLCKPYGNSTIKFFSFQLSFDLWIHLNHI